MKIKVQKIKITEQLAGTDRLSKFIVGRFVMLETASAAKKAIKRGHILLNGRIGNTGDFVHTGDLIEYHQPLLSKSNLELDFDIVYKDDYLLIINKRPGVLSSGHTGPSLQSALQSYPSSYEDDALSYPMLVHRLDRATSGLMIAARTMSTRRKLGALISDRGLHKEYALIVDGQFKKRMKWINAPIDGKKAKTEILSIQPLSTRDQTTYIRVRLHTGRTHQIRKHMASVGHPIIGDEIYNQGGVTFGRGLFLMADRLVFSHPITDEALDMKIKLHNKFSKYVNLKSQ